MKILLVGLPATGKTCIGEYFRDQYGYQLFDVEKVIRENANPIPPLMQFVEEQSENKIVTWGFHPCNHEHHIRKIRACGYNLIWMDGPRSLIKMHFIRRGDVQLHLLYDQLTRIDGMDFWSLSPSAIVVPYGSDGEFLDKKAIAELILSVPVGRVLPGR